MRHPGAGGMRSESAAGQDRRPSEKPRLRLRIRLWQLAGGRRRRRMRVNPARSRVPPAARCQTSPTPQGRHSWCERCHSRDEQSLTGGPKRRRPQSQTGRCGVSPQKGWRRTAKPFADRGRPSPLFNISAQADTPLPPPPCWRRLAAGRYRSPDRPRHPTPPSAGAAAPI